MLERRFEFEMRMGSDKCLGIICKIRNGVYTRTRHGSTKMRLCPLKNSQPSLVSITPFTNEHSRATLTPFGSSSSKNIVIVILVQTFPTGYLRFLAGKRGIIAKSHVQQSYLQPIITHQTDQGVCFRCDGLLVQQHQ